MYDKSDSETLNRIKEYNSKRNTDFSKRLSSSQLSAEELDELFLEE